MLLIAACGGEQVRGRPGVEASVPTTPSAGTIVLYDPQPGRKGQRALRPTTITITTEGSKGQRADEPAQTAAGTIPQEGRAKRPTEKEVSRKILEEARSNSACVISPERFRQFWELLVESGVFKLPRYSGGIPPEDKPSIRMTAEGKTWILLRPTDAPSQISPDPEERKAVAEAWQNVKLQIMLMSQS